MTETTTETTKPGLHRRLYAWVLHWAYTPYGTPALGLLAFTESSFFLVPPDVLLIPLALSRRSRWLFYATVCTLCSVLGGLFGYLIGAVLWHEAGVSEFFFEYVPGFTPELFAEVQKLYQDWDFLIVFTAGFTPIPFKVITITAGVFDLNVLLFTIAAVVGRGGRFYLVAWLVRRYGERAQRILERRFNLFCILFVLLLIGGFIVIDLLVDAE